MATLNAYEQLTLLELARRHDPKGAAAVVAEVLTEDNEWLMDAVWGEANDVFSHKHTRRASLPQGEWRKLNEGVGTAASQTIQIVENIGMLEIYAEADKALVDAAANPAAFRMTEQVAFMEGLGQQLTATWLYGDEDTDPERFTGMAPRLNALGTLVVGEGGTGSDLTSIYIVQWGEMGVNMVFPSGAGVGITHQDLGEQTLLDANSKQFQGYRDHYQVKAGLVVRDDRCLARLANIETSGTTNTFDEDNLITLLNRMKNRGRGATIYVNETVLTQMEIALKDKSNVYYTAGGGEGLAGEPMIRFRGHPIRFVDQILDTEGQVS